MSLASDVELGNHICDVDERLKLAPFSMFFLVRKTMDALVHRKPMPTVFLQVLQKYTINEIKFFFGMIIFGHLVEGVAETR